MKYLDYKQFQRMEQVLIYDIESENNEQHPPTTDHPEPPKPQSPVSSTIATKTIKVHSNSSEQSPEKEQDLLPVKKQRKKSENIIFFEQELGRSNRSIEYDQTTRGFLKKNMPSSDQEYEEDDSEQEQELKPIEQEETQPSSKRKIVPVQTTLPNQQVLVTANINLLSQQPVPPNYRLKCYITIERSLLGFAQVYRLFLGEEKQFMMAAKKESFKYYSNFLVSTHPNHINKRSNDWIGRLESNFLGTEFKYYSVQDGFQTLKLTANYDKNFVGFMGLRSFSVTKVHPKAKKGKYLNTLSSILQRNERSKLIEMDTAEPKLVRGKYRLDFGGKVRIPSSRNFILLQNQQQSLLFGKVTPDSYVMEVSYPLSPFEAFGVCLTSLDSKLMVS